MTGRKSGRLPTTNRSTRVCVYVLPACQRHAGHQSNLEKVVDGQEAIGEGKRSNNRVVIVVG
jgi:hypothetical protein